MKTQLTTDSGSDLRPSMPQSYESVWQGTVPLGFSCTEDHVDEWMRYLQTHAY